MPLLGGFKKSARVGNFGMSERSELRGVFSVFFSGFFWGGFCKIFWAARKIPRLPELLDAQISLRPRFVDSDSRWYGGYER